MADLAGANRDRYGGEVDGARPARVANRGVLEPRHVVGHRAVEGQPIPIAGPAHRWPITVGIAADAVIGRRREDDLGVVAPDRDERAANREPPVRIHLDHSARLDGQHHALGYGHRALEHVNLVRRPRRVRIDGARVGHNRTGDRWPPERQRNRDRRSQTTGHHPIPSSPVFVSDIGSRGADAPSATNHRLVSQGRISRSLAPPEVAANERSRFGDPSRNRTPHRARISMYANIAPPTSDTQLSRRRPTLVRARSSRAIRPRIAPLPPRPCRYREAASIADLRPREHRRLS